MTPVVPTAPAPGVVEGALIAGVVPAGEVPGGAFVGGVCDGGVPATGLDGGVAGVVGDGVVGDGVVGAGAGAGVAADGVVPAGAPATDPVAGLAGGTFVPMDGDMARAVPMAGLDRMNCGPAAAVAALSGWPGSAPGRMQPLTVTASVPVPAELCGDGDCAAVPTPRVHAAAVAITMFAFMTFSLIRSSTRVASSA